MQPVRWVRDHPRQVFGVLVPTLVACWFLARVGGDRTPSDGGLYWVGAGFWLGFGLTLVVTAMYGVVQLLRLVLRREALT